MKLSHEILSITGIYYICKVEDEILQHNDEYLVKHECDTVEYLVKHECDAVLMKPIDMKKWFKHKIITTAIDADTQKHYMC